MPSNDEIKENSCHKFLLRYIFKNSWHDAAHGGQLRVTKRLINFYERQKSAFHAPPTTVTIKTRMTTNKIS